MESSTAKGRHRGASRPKHPVNLTYLRCYFLCPAFLRRVRRLKAESKARQEVRS